MAPASAVSPGRAAVAGATAAGLALGVSELLTGLAPSSPSLILAAGKQIIIRMPPAIEEAAIETLGTDAKVLLVLVVLASCVGLGALLGVLGRRRFWLTATASLLLALPGIVAGVSEEPEAALATIAAALAAVAVGLAALHGILAAELAREVRGVLGPTGRLRPERRRFLRLAMATALSGATTGIAGRVLVRFVGGGTSPRDVRLPPVPAAGQAPTASTFQIQGLSPLFTPNRDFYRIDTALAVPQVDVDSWRLRVTGMVDRPLELSFGDLLALPQTEAPITLCCVSNKVGDSLVGTARWQGVVLADILGRAGVQPAATQIVGRSVDGWSGGFPTGAAFDGRLALVAVGMNGEPLPRVHGFPARLVVAGLYGFVSATKWLEEIELTTLDAFDGYWVTRGWAKRAPVKIQSRIDLPRFGSTLAPGRRPLAGVAWAPPAGIASVEVSIDGDAWIQAALSEPVSPSVWRQWRYDWDAAPGRHEIRVRATDTSGVTQSGVPSPVLPDGATGYHTVRVRVADRSR